MPEPPPTADLPEDLQQQVAELLLGPASERDQELAALAARHPAHAAALQRAAADLEATERLLAGGFPDSALPERLGPYVTLRRLGEGAFGEVFLCRQQLPLPREVAVKVLRPGAGDRQTLQRFETERRLLASLQHPAIAQVFDAGTLADGRPYFAMDHVDGPSLTVYCDHHALSVEQRLELFEALGRGVQHAHEHGIVHRDLKPANVLVVAHDGRPQPKIIDFGIAKLLQRTAPADATEAGRVVGTPGYMSPEQAQGRPGDVDERTDVFALGVLLYELLTGVLPWRAADAPDTDPVRPSTRIAGEPTRDAVAGRRSTDARRLAGRLRGDLDWIVLRALQPARERRYPSVRELLLDLQRHRQGRPVLAGPPALGYRLRKFGRRHRLTLGAGIAVLLSVGASLWLLARWRDDLSHSEHRRHEQALATARLLFERANDPLLEHAPRSDELRQALMQDVLALQQQALAARAADPAAQLLRVQTLNELADTYYQLARFDEGERLAAEAVQAAQALLADAPDDHDRMAALAAALRHQGRCALLGRRAEAGAAAGAAAIGLLERLAGDPGGGAVGASAHANQLAQTLVEHAAAQGQLGDSQRQLQSQRRAIVVLEQLLAVRPDDAVAQRNVVRFLCGLANMLGKRGEHDAAGVALQHAGELAAVLPHVGDEERARVAHRRGTHLASTGAATAAIAEFERGLELHRRLLRLHPGRLGWRVQCLAIARLLGELHVARRDYVALATVARDAIADAAALAPTHPRWRQHTAVALLGLGDALAGAPDRAARELAHRCLERAAAAAAELPADDPDARNLPLHTKVALGLAVDRLQEPWLPGAWEPLVQAAEHLGEPWWSARAAFGLAAARFAAGDATGARLALDAASTASGRLSPDGPEPVPGWQRLWLAFRIELMPPRRIAGAGG